MPKILTSKGSSYEILFSIKETPTKKIYKALRKEAGVKQEVLLKIFSQKEESYKGELESLLQTDSNYCARLLAFETFSSGKALVLEYIEGLSLFQLVKTFKLSPSEIHTLLIFIYKGLVDLKKQGLAHGDLSLDNILIDQQVQIKFIDFGKGNYQESSLGTFPFVAPEILKGGLAYFSSDLFSLGVIETFLKNPEKISRLKQYKPEDFISSTNPLLASDPQARFFKENFKLSEKEKKLALHTLSHKIRDFLSSVESKRYETQKISPIQKSLFPFKPLAQQIILLLFFSLFAGASSFSKRESSLGGFLKVSTNQWFFVQLKDFESYTPFNLSLPVGWYHLRWKSPKGSGIKTIHIKPRQILLLNDQDFLETSHD